MRNKAFDLSGCRYYRFVKISVFYDYFIIFAPNTNLMMQPTNKQITPLTEFVDSVFAELSSWVDEESPCCFVAPYRWKDTLIPLAVRLYELAQTNAEVYWWLLNRMSKVDFCKDGEEFFGKGDVFSMLLYLDSFHSRIILEKSVPQHVDELLGALKAEDLDAFMNFMPVGEENTLIYNICRVLKRVEDVRKIYKDALSQTWGEPLGSLFLYIRRLFEYFAASYYDNHRPCDGMAYNFFLALCHTPYYGDRDSFSDLMNRLGELWIRGLRMTYLSEKDQMPSVVSQAFFEMLHGENAELLEELRIKLEGQRNEELRDKLITLEEGWLELDNYSFVCKRMSWGCSRPPYDWRGKPGNVRIYSERIPGSRVKVPGRYRVVDRIILDNEPIPMEELKAVATSEEPANVEMANIGDGIAAKGPLYPESKWGFIPDDYFELKSGINEKEYFDTMYFDLYWRDKGIDYFAELINYLARECYIPDDDEYKAILAYRLTGLNRPVELKKIPWKGKNSKDSPLELYYLVKHWVKQNMKKNPQCKEFFVGPLWIKNPSEKVKDCSHAFQRKLKSLYDIPPECD